MEFVRFLTHYGLHFLAPGIIAYIFFKNNWKTVYLLLLATMLIDLDHLYATPLFNPNRCSINYHPLHSYYAIILYLFLLIPVKTRIIAIGLLFHMLTDYIDCQWI
ncbi:DUF6122 family protein [uncultured Lutibacter sp.]|uniref:DUF6122 family protein n=1 Tax=uncultured Lutibacter sp. TaxID=437739 RepID=UPI00342699B7